MAKANRKLSKYREKRDFQKTAEPSGAQAVPAGNALRFVIQKHAARRLLLNETLQGRHRPGRLDRQAQIAAQNLGQFRPDADNPTL